MPLKVPDVLIFRVGPQSRGPLYVPDGAKQQRRTPGKGSLQVPERAEPPRKTCQRGLLMTSYKRIGRQSQNCGRGGSQCPHTLGVTGVLASQAAAPPSRPTLTGAELPQAKKKDVFMRAGSLPSHPTLCDPVDCGLPGFSVREGILQARILARIGQYWLPYPSRALYFLLP